VRKKTLAAFEAWRADPLSASILVQRVAEGETLRDICASMGVAYSLVARHVAGTPALNAEYEAALAIWGDALAQETLAIADGTKGTAEAAVVAVAKLRAETRMRLAGKWDRKRYGERDAGLVQVNVNLGDTAREIQELEARLGIRDGARLPTGPLPLADMAQTLSPPYVMKEEALGFPASERPEDI
jgi:hypothetical protein